MAKTKNQFVTNLSELKLLIATGQYEYALILGGGIAYSRKTIKYDSKTKLFKILNHIDNTNEVLSAQQLKNTNIGKAMPLNSLVCIIK
jgi:hypothetical protein